MTIDTSLDRCVERQLIDALKHEQQLADLCEQMECVTQGFEAANRFRERAAQLSRLHAEVLCNRLLELGIEPPVESKVPQSPLHTCRPIDAVREIGEAVFAATMANSALMHVSIRHLDSWIAAPSGTTAHIARQFMQECHLLLGEIATTLPDTLLAELEAVGEQCRCTCPSCSSGFCLCGQSAPWREASLAGQQAAKPEYIRLAVPRADSPARRAGLRAGDELMEIDGVEIDTLATLTTGIKSVAPGGVFSVRVRRNGELITARLIRPEDAATLPANVQEATECLQPSGQAFYLDRARDLQKQVRRAGKPLAPHPDGLEGLTARELQVLRLVADGATNPMIAERLQIARPTVARHVASILAKLGTANRAEAAGLAASKGFRFDA